jgi:hypothetical protein
MTGLWCSGIPASKEDFNRRFPPEALAAARREIFQIKMASPDLIKVGPEGYIHGYICVRPPCGAKEPDKISAKDLSIRRDGVVVHRPSGYSVGRIDRDDDGKYVASHVPGGTTKHSKRDGALSAIAGRHNAAHREKNAEEEPKAKPEVKVPEKVPAPGGKKKPADMSDDELAEENERLNRHAKEFGVPRKGGAAAHYHEVKQEILDRKAHAARSSWMNKKPENATEAKLQDAMKSGIKTDKTPDVEGVQSNTHILTFNDGSKWVRKDLGNSPMSSENIEFNIDKEVLASKVSTALGAGAPEVIKMGPSEIYMPFVNGHAAAAATQPGGEAWQSAEDDDKYFSKLINSPEGQKIGLLDMLIGESDRHYGNVMITSGGKPVPIDHNDSWGMVNADGSLAYSSPFAAQLEQKVKAGKSPFSAADISAAEGRIKALKPEFDKVHEADFGMSGNQLYDLTMKRIAKLKKQIGG